jgi:hypothetical protein
VPPELWQGFAKGNHPIVLGGIAHGAPAWMIPVLLPSSSIASGGLQVPVWAWTDPDVRPCRRDGKGLKTAQHCRVSYELPVKATVTKAAASAWAPDARLSIRHVAQPGRLRRFLGGNGQPRSLMRRLRCHIWAFPLRAMVRQGGTSLLYKGEQHNLCQNPEPPRHHVRRKCNKKVTSHPIPTEMPFQAVFMRERGLPCKFPLQGLYVHASWCPERA